MPKAVAAGHGELPLSVAKRLEAGNLSATDRQRYSDRIEAYERRYGPAGQRAGKRHTFPRVFATRQSAVNYARHRLQVPEGYYRVDKVKGGWQLTLLR